MTICEQCPLPDCNEKDDRCLLRPAKKEKRTFRGYYGNRKEIMRLVQISRAKDYTPKVVEQLLGA